MMKILFILLAILPAKAIATCENDDTFRYLFEGKERKCTNIRLDEERRQLLCKMDKVREACPQTCGLCCENMDGYSFRRKNGMTGTCDWLTSVNAKQRKARYCGRYYSNGRNVRDGCPVACNFCQDRVDSPPSAAPSISPAPSATHAPTVTCQNDGEFTFELTNVGSSVGCSWITQNNVALRRETYCNDPTIATACSQACGKCCGDEGSYEFHLVYSNEKRKCSWIAKNWYNREKRRALYCNKRENGQMIGHACAESCGMCM